MNKFEKNLKRLLQVLSLLEEVVIRIISLVGWILILLKVLGL